VDGLRDLVTSASLYGRSSLRLLQRTRRQGVEERLVFVVGCPRSGTTFVGGSLGSQPGFVDLGEVHPLKAAIPRLVELPDDEAAQALRRSLEVVRLLGRARGLRAVEQTPETAFVLRAALLAYPQARAVHVVRDARDVVSSLLERGWLSEGRAGADDVGSSYGSRCRFWVPPDRAASFEHESDATRAALAWRQYVTAARAVPDRTLELRYESLAADPEGAAELVAGHLGSDPAPLAQAFADAHDGSIGRWRRDLTPEQVEDVEREAGALLENLGYAHSIGS
jgi:hypothetical protein